MVLAVWEQGSSLASCTRIVASLGQRTNGVGSMTAKEGPKPVLRVARKERELLSILRLHKSAKARTTQYTRLSASYERTTNQHAS